MIVRYVLPYPQTANKIWRVVNNKMLLSAEGRHYHRQVKNIITAEFLSGTVIDQESLARDRIARLEHELDEARNLLAILQPIGNHRSLTGRLRVRIESFAADRRRRDLDNILQGPLDGLTHSGLWQDDSQIDDLQVIREALDAANPRIEVTVQEVIRTGVF